MSVCVGYDIGSGSPCDRKGIHDVLAGCIHEHLGWRLLCAWHVADVNAGYMHCGDCAEADCHGCTLHIIRREPAARTGMPS